MTDVFVKLCERKKQQEVLQSETSRANMNDSVFVVGQYESSFETKIQRYSIESNSWKMIDSTSLLGENAQIHFIKGNGFVVLGDLNYTEVQVSSNIRFDRIAHIIINGFHTILGVFNRCEHNGNN